MKFFIAAKMNRSLGNRTLNCPLGAQVSGVNPSQEMLI